MFGDLSEGVNWLAVGAGAVASGLLGWFWLSPKAAGPALAMALALGLLAWTMGLAETRQAFLPMVVVVLTVMAFVALGGLTGGRSLWRILSEAGFVLVAAVIMFVAQVIF